MKNATPLAHLNVDEGEVEEANDAEEEEGALKTLAAEDAANGLSIRLLGCSKGLPRVAVEGCLS